MELDDQNTSVEVTNLTQAGFTVFRSLLDSEQISQLRVYADTLMERCLERQRNVGNVVHNLFRTDNVVPDFMFPNSLYLSRVWRVIEDILGRDFNLIEGFIHFSLPGSQTQELHLDIAHLFPAETFVTPPFILAMHFPLCDFTPTSGGTRIYAGSHLRRDAPPRLEDEAPSDIVERTVMMSAGDVLLRDCRAWHAAGPNRSSEPRAMFSFAFSSSWFMTKALVSEDLYFSLPPAARPLQTLLSGQ